jgi:hypothetical protein
MLSLILSEHGSHGKATCQKCRTADVASKKRKRRAAKKATALKLNDFGADTKRHKGLRPLDHEDTDASDDEGLVSS